MATFKNLKKSLVVLNDENGRSFKFDALEQRADLSNYFENYTSTSMSDPILQRVGQLDGDGTVPHGIVDEENLIENPGNPNTYPVTRAADSSNLNPTNSGAARTSRVSWDASNDVVGRQVDTRFVGLREAPTEDHTEVIATATGLDGATTYDITATDGPIKVNGRRATAADAAANPAVEEGEYYTAFGSFQLTDDGTSDTGTYFFAIQGSGTQGSGATFTFVADVDTDPPTANVPVPVTTGSSIDVNGTTYITLAAMTSGAAADTSDLTVNWTQIPLTAANVAAVMPLASQVEGLFFQAQEGNGTLFIIKDGVAYAINADSKNALS